jgi:hypothetical protein
VTGEKKWQGEKKGGKEKDEKGENAAKGAPGPWVLRGVAQDDAEALDRVLCHHVLQALMNGKEKGGEGRWIPETNNEGTDAECNEWILNICMYICIYIWIYIYI